MFIDHKNKIFIFDNTLKLVNIPSMYDTFTLKNFFKQLKTIGGGKRNLRIFVILSSEPPSKEGINYNSFFRRKWDYIKYKSISDIIRKITDKDVLFESDYEKLPQKINPNNLYLLFERKIRTDKTKSHEFESYSFNINPYKRGHFVNMIINPKDISNYKLYRIPFSLEFVVEIKDKYEYCILKGDIINFIDSFFTYEMKSKRDYKLYVKPRIDSYESTDHSIYISNKFFMVIKVTSEKDFKLFRSLYSNYAFKIADKFSIFPWIVEENYNDDELKKKFNRLKVVEFRWIWNLLKHGLVYIPKSQPPEPEHEDVMDTSEDFPNNELPPYFKLMDELTSFHIYEHNMFDVETLQTLSDVDKDAWNSFSKNLVTNVIDYVETFEIIGRKSVKNYLKLLFGLEFKIEKYAVKIWVKKEYKERFSYYFKSHIKSVHKAMLFYQLFLTKKHMSLTNNIPGINTVTYYTAQQNIKNEYEFIHNFLSFVSQAKRIFFIVLKIDFYNEEALEKVIDSFKTEYFFDLLKTVQRFMSALLPPGNLYYKSRKYHYRKFHYIQYNNEFYKKFEGIKDEFDVNYTPNNLDTLVDILDEITEKELTVFESIEDIEYHTKEKITFEFLNLAYFGWIQFKRIRQIVEEGEEVEEEGEDERQVKRKIEEENKKIEEEIFNLKLEKAEISYSKEIHELIFHFEKFERSFKLLKSAYFVNFVDINDLEEMKNV